MGNLLVEHKTSVKCETSLLIVSGNVDNVDVTLLMLCDAAKRELSAAAV